MNDGSNTDLGPSPSYSPPEDFPEVTVIDGGLLQGGRERAWVLPCGNTIAVSAVLLESSKDDVMHSLNRLARHHMWVHERDDVSTLQCAHVEWVDNEGNTRRSAEFLT